MKKLNFSEKSKILVKNTSIVTTIAFDTSPVNNAKQTANRAVLKIVIILNFLVLSRAKTPFLGDTESPSILKIIKKLYRTKTRIFL